MPVMPAMLATKSYGGAYATFCSRAGKTGRGRSAKVITTQWQLAASTTSWLAFEKR